MTTQAVLAKLQVKHLLDQLASEIFVDARVRLGLYLSFYRAYSNTEELYIHRLHMNPQEAGNHNGAYR